MSDPVTNIEIEDVLSSIRRLVSDEARASEKSEREDGFSSDVPPQAVELEAESEESDAKSLAPAPKVAPPALVLTPALRIEPDEDENTPSNDEVAVDQTPDEQSESPTLILSPDDQAVDFEDNSSDHDVIEESSVAPELVENIEEHDARPSDPETDPDLPQDHQNDEAVENEQASEQASEEVVAGEAHLDEISAPVEEPLEEPVTIEDKIAALEALISRSDTDFEPDGTGDGANAGRPGNALPWEDSQEQRGGGLQTGTLSDPSSPSQTAAFHDGAAAFERAHAEAVSAAETEIAEDASETLLASGNIASELDEDMLRDMVAEIVRQELQGPLGERITRNVRKLVRREIYRALAANELD
ncbi:hypothetical protein [Planktotalea sp.]|uniref:hypothetical protein n=1 Tax=Planktotalea sp. TaxID=2029877 RepID=UPI003F6CB6E3